MHAAGVLDQHTTLTHGCSHAGGPGWLGNRCRGRRPCRGIAASLPAASRNAAGPGTCMPACNGRRGLTGHHIGHPHEHEVGGRRVHRVQPVRPQRPLRPHQRLQPCRQDGAGLAERGRLLCKHLEMLQRKTGGFGIQHTDVVGWTDPVQRFGPGWLRGQIAEAGTGQAPFRAGAHHRQIGPGVELRHPAGPAGKRRIGFVQHHQTVGGAQDGLHGRRVEQVAGGIVRVGKEH